MAIDKTKLEAELSKMKLSTSDSPSSITSLESDPLVAGISKLKSISNETSFIAISVICQKGGTAKKAQGNIYAIVDAARIELSDIHTVMNTNKIRYSLRQWAPTNATMIYKIAFRFDIAGDLYKKLIHSNFDINKEEAIWASFFKTILIVLRTLVLCYGNILIIYSRGKTLMDKLPPYLTEDKRYYDLPESEVMMLEVTSSNYEGNKSQLFSSINSEVEFFSEPTMSSEELFLLFPILNFENLRSILVKLDPNEKIYWRSVQIDEGFTEIYVRNLHGVVMGALYAISAINPSGFIEE